MRNDTLAADEKEDIAKMFGVLVGPRGEGQDNIARQHEAGLQA
jgi:hypothetical protein